jgi:thymidylate synthase
MNFEEKQYLNHIKNIIDNGYLCDDRTKIGTKSIFGCQMKFNINTHFPLLTTKKMFTKGIIEELLWFLNGKTDSKLLEEKGVNIWKDNSSREFLDNIKLYDRKEGDCGPIYGFNFRHYGEKYIDNNSEYKGIDQINNVIEMIKTDPNSRRIIINLWDPTKIDEMVLPPCHVLYQFRVYGNKLLCSLYQRSGDMGLGIPFNIASASLLTCIIAKLTNLEPYELTHSIGDAHIYLNHEKALQNQLEREPYEFPKLKIRDRNQQKVEDFVIDDFIFEDYKYYDKIYMKMAV